MARMSPAERVLVDNLQQQIDAYKDGTAGDPAPVARWLRLLADKIDPACPDDCFDPFELRDAARR